MNFSVISSVRHHQICLTIVALKTWLAPQHLKQQIVVVRAQHGAQESLNLQMAVVEDFKTQQTPLALLLESH